MALGVVGAFERVRNQVFERSPVLEVARHLYPDGFDGHELFRAAHWHKAYQALRSRLNAEQVRIAREAGELWPEALAGDLDFLREALRAAGMARRIETLEDGYDGLWALVKRIGALMPLRAVSPRYPPHRPEEESLLPLGVFVDEQEARLPEAIMAQLAALLGKLVRAFLDELEKVGKFELPPVATARVRVPFRLPGARDDAAGHLGAGGVWESEGHGAASVVVLNVGAGGVATGASLAHPGPALIEHVGAWSDQAFDGRVQARILGGGARVGATTPAADVLGDSLFEGASNVGTSGTVIPWTAFNVMGEWWPRRLILERSFVVMLTVQNLSAAARWFSLSFERRGAWRAD